MKNPRTPAKLPKYVSLPRYAAACGVTYQAIFARTKAKNNPLPVVERFDEETQERRKYIDTELHPPVRLDKGRKAVAPAKE